MSVQGEDGKKNNDDSGFTANVMAGDATSSAGAGPTASGAATGPGIDPQQLRELVAGMIRESLDAARPAAATSAATSGRGPDPLQENDAWQWSRDREAAADKNKETSKDNDWWNTDDGAGWWKAGETAKDDEKWWSSGETTKNDENWRSWSGQEYDGWWKSYSWDSSWRSAGPRWDDRIKGDYSDPPAWPGWSHYRQWRKALRRWNTNTDVPVWRRSEKTF